MIDYNWKVPKTKGAKKADLKNGANKSEFFITVFEAYGSILWKKNNDLMK